MKRERASTDFHRRKRRRKGRPAIAWIVAGLLLACVTQAGALFNDVPPIADEPVASPAPPEHPLGLEAEPAGRLSDAAQASRVSVGPTREPDPAPVAEDPPAPRPAGREASEEPLNVLVLGVDKRPGAEDDAGSRSDTIMLVQVAPGTGEVELLSVPRDLLVELWPGKKDRVNAAYSYGGVELTRAVMEGLTGVPIDNYAIVDFEGFKDAIDAMGGVHVDVEDEIPPKYGIKDGPQTLSGSQALFYARYRGTAGGDLDRIEHQQRLISALRSKALQWNTVTKLPLVAGSLMRNVETDLGLAETVAVGRALASNGEGKGVSAVQLKGYPTTTPDGDQVLVPDWETNAVLLKRFQE